MVLSRARRLWLSRTVALSPGWWSLSTWPAQVSPTGPARRALPPRPGCPATLADLNLPIELFPPHHQVDCWPSPAPLTSKRFESALFALTGCSSSFRRCCSYKDTVISGGPLGRAVQAVSSPGRRSEIHDVPPTHHDLEPC